MKSAKVVTASMIQGGGMGIFGDFMFGEFNRYGQSFTKTLAGPGFGTADDITSLFANGAAGGFSADLLFTSFVFWFFMFVQYKNKQDPAPWIFIILNLSVGLSCALPAYLFAIEASKSEN